MGTRRDAQVVRRGRARVVDAISLSIPITSLDGKDPRESTEMVDAVAEVLKKLAAEVG